MTITPVDIAATIETAPAWALLGLTVRSERLRADAVMEMARHLHVVLYAPPEPDARQLALPL